MPSGHINIMNQVNKPRARDEILFDHLKIQSAGRINLKSSRQDPAARMQSAVNIFRHTTTNAYSETDNGGGRSSGAIYIIGNSNSKPNTMDRKNHPSWVSSTSAGRTAAQPQTTKGAGYLSGNGNAGMSSMPSATTTVTGSSNTINDIVSDYHSGSNYVANEAGSASDYHFTTATSTPPPKNLSSNGSFHLNNGSTVKLLSNSDDQTNTQVSWIDVVFYLALVFKTNLPTNIAVKIFLRHFY